MSLAQAIGESRRLGGTTLWGAGVGGWRERDRHRDRETERQRRRQRHKETHRETQRDTHTETGRDRDINTDREKERKKKEKNNYRFEVYQTLEFKLEKGWGYYNEFLYTFFPVNGASTTGAMLTSGHVTRQRGGHVQNGDQ